MKSKMNICSYTIHTAMLYRTNGLNKIKQAGNQNGYSLQGLQKWKSKQSLSSNYDIYLYDRA